MLTNILQVVFSIVLISLLCKGMAWVFVYSLKELFSFLDNYISSNFIGIAFLVLDNEFNRIVSFLELVFWIMLTAHCLLHSSIIGG